MEDQVIINLYFDRSENAIAETKTKYGRMLRGIALGILKSMSDAEECENDTYMKTWDSIPPTRPNVFLAFLSKIIRNLSLDRYDYIHAEKRGSGEILLLLDELSECIPDRNNTTEHAEEEELKEIINVFLDSLKADARNIFMRRYWFGDSVQEIAFYSGFGISKIKMSLMRSRKELKAVLEKEGHVI
jgi:RNA polymerase sigma factor (sigma-70 family)